MRDRSDNEDKKGKGHLGRRKPDDAYKGRIGMLRKLCQSGFLSRYSRKPFKWTTGSV